MDTFFQANGLWLAVFFSLWCILMKAGTWISALYSLKATICDNADSGWLKEVIKQIVKTFHAGKVSNFATS